MFSLDTQLNTLEPLNVCDLPNVGCHQVQLPASCSTTLFRIQEPKLNDPWWIICFPGPFSLITHEL